MPAVARTGAAKKTWAPPPAEIIPTTAIHQHSAAVKPRRTTPVICVAAGVTAVINPRACSVLADNNSQVPEGSTYAGGSTQSAADKTATIITVFAVQDPAVMTDQLEKSKSAHNQCANFTVQAKGQQIAFQLQPLDAKTSGEESISALSNQTLPDGQKATSVTVTGVKGTLAATAVKAGPSLTGDAAAELVQLVDAVLAKG